MYQAIQRRHLLGALLVVFTCAVSLPVSAQHAARQKPEDVIHNALQAYETAWNAGDVRSIVDLFTTDADYTAFGGLLTRGRADIEGRYTSLLTDTFRGTQITMEMSSLRFLTPDVAIVDGTLQLSGVAAPKGSSQTAKGLFLTIMTAQRDGGWRFTSFWSKRVDTLIESR